MKELTGNELLDWPSRLGAQAPLLLDVREPWEVALAPICVEGLRCLAIPMNEVPARHGELRELEPIVCICHRGARSAQVASFLERQGFDAVYNLVGGSEAWSLEIDPAVPRY
jgi:rhodanese-related sulfurtransferase